MTIECLNNPWTIILPKPDGVADEALQKAHNFLNVELTKLAGGYTVQENIGFWVGDHGKPFLVHGLGYTVSGDFGFEVIKDTAGRAATIGHLAAVYFTDPFNAGWLVRFPTDAEGATSNEREQACDQGAEPYSTDGDQS
jgi:hypothetical protein